MTKKILDNENTSYLEENKTLLLSSNIYDLQKFLGKKAQLTMSITLPGTFESTDLSDYATLDGNTVTYDLTQYINAVNEEDAGNYTETISISSKKIGGNSFKVVAVIGGFIAIVLISKLVQKINKGPFED